MDEEGRSNRSGLPMFHLRRIGPPATRPRVADIMDFYEVTTMIGKSPQSTYIIDSASDMRRKYISRNHARVVIRTPSNDHRLFDDSMNGVFVNNLKILHNVTLTEGDRVTFGHPRGAEIPGGMRKLQPDSEYQFLFERCNCPGQMIVSHRPSGDRPFAVPDVPVQAAKSKSKKRDRNATTILTTEDVLKLKDEYEQKSPSPPSASTSRPSSNNDIENQQDYSALGSTTTQPSNQDSSASGETAAEHRVKINKSSHNCDRDTSYRPTVTETPCVSSEQMDTETRPAVTETPCASSEQMDTETRPAVTETPCISSEQMDTETRPAVTETPCISSEQMDTEDRPTVTDTPRVSSQQMDTETSAISNEDDINEPRQHQGENYILHPSDANADNCGECSKNSANLTENDSLRGNDPNKVSVSGDEDSKNSASLSVEDSFELVVNLPNTIDTTKSPTKTSTPKPKQAVHKSRVSYGDSRSEEASSLQTSAVSGNVQAGGSLEGNSEVAIAISSGIKQLRPTYQVSQMDASIQTSPLVSLVKEPHAPDTQQRRLSSTDPVQEEEENILAGINAGQETIEAQGPCESQTSDVGNTDLSSIHKTTNTSGLETNICLHEKFKVPEISDFDRHVQMDQEVESCTSQSTDSAECPTEIIINNPDQDFNYKDMFEDSDMDDGVFDEDATKEVYMDTCDIDKVGTEAADRTGIVSEGEIDPAGDLNETLNKTVELSGEVTNDVQLDKTGSVSESEVCGMEQDSAEQTGTSDTLRQFENSKDIEGDVSLVKDTEAQDNISEIKENNPVVSKETFSYKSDFMESGTPIVNQEKDASQENVNTKHDNSQMDTEVALFVPELAYTKDNEADSASSNPENLGRTFNEVEKPEPSEIGLNSRSAAADIELESYPDENYAEETIDSVLSDSNKSDLNIIVMNGSENNTVDDDKDAKEKDTNSATVTMHTNELNVTATKEADKLNSDFSSDSDLENMEPADVDIYKNSFEYVKQQEETSNRDVTSDRYDHEKGNNHNTMTLEQESTIHHHEENSESKEQNEEALTKDYPGEMAGDNIQIGHCAGLEQGEDVVDNRTVECCKESSYSAISPNISLVSTDAHLCHQSDINMDGGASPSLVMESLEKQTMDSETVQTSGVSAEKIQELCKDSVLNLNLECSLDMQSEEKMDESERVALNQTQEDFSTDGNIEDDVSAKSHKTTEKAWEGSAMVTEDVISEQVQEGTETKRNSEAEEVMKTDKDSEVNKDITEQEQICSGRNDDELVSEPEQEDRGMDETSVTEERPCEQTQGDETNENGQPEEEISEQMQEGRDMHETSETGEGHSEQNCQAEVEISEQVQESKEDVGVTPESIQEGRETDENSETEEISEDIEIDENGHVEEVFSKQVQEHKEAETGGVVFEKIQEYKASKMTETACINVADKDRVLSMDVFAEGKEMTVISMDQIKGEFPPPDTDRVAVVEVQEQIYEGIDGDRNSELQSESEKTAEHILEGPTTERTSVDDVKGLASTEQVSDVSSPKMEAEAESALEHVQESTETDGIIKDEPDAAISMEKTQVTLYGEAECLDPLCEDSPPTEDIMETETEDISLENLAETDSIDRDNELRTINTTPDGQIPKVCPSTKEIMEADGTSSGQTLVDITPTEGNIEDGSPSDRSNEAETDGNDETEDKQQGSLSETEANTTIDTEHVQVQESSASEGTKFTDEGPEKCIATESDCVGSSSPISRKIQALQDFCQSIPPLTKATENNNNIEVFMSPATKRRKDRADASDMISCLEDSISSVDNASDLEDVSVSLHEVKDMPPVFIVDMETLDKKDCNGNKNVSRKLNMADEQKEERKDVQSNISICRLVGNEATSPDIKLTKTPVEIQEEKSSHCQSPKENFPQNCLTSILEDSSSSNTTSTKDQEMGVQSIEVKENCIHCEDKTLETCTGLEKAAVDEKPVQNIDLIIEDDRETMEGCSVDSTPESSMDFSSMSLTDSCTSRFSESNLVTVWEIDNRNLSNANSVEEIGDELLLTNSNSTQVAESTPDECSPALESTDSTQVTELTPDELPPALESTDSIQIIESKSDEHFHALESTDSTQVAESTPDELPPALQSTNSTQVSESTPDEHYHAYDSTNAIQVVESTPDEFSPALVLTDSTQVAESKETHSSQITEATKLDTEKTPGIETTILNNEETPCARSIDAMETETRNTSCHSQTQCSAHHETTKHVTQIKIKDSPENSRESMQQLENSGDSHDTVSCNIPKGKRKRKMSNEISEDEQHGERKKRKTLYQNVKTTVTNFFNIKDKVSLKKSACSNKQLRKENISKMVKRFFFLKGKQTRSVQASQDRGNMESAGETVASHSVVLAESSQHTESHGMDTTLTKSLEQTDTYSLDNVPSQSSEQMLTDSVDTALTKSSDETVPLFVDTTLTKSSDEAVPHSVDITLTKSSDETVPHFMDTTLTKSSEQTDTYSLDNMPSQSSEQILTNSTYKIILTDSSEKTTTQTVVEMKAGSSLQTEHSNHEHGAIPVDSHSNEHVHSSAGEHKVSGSLQTSDTAIEVSSNACDNKDGSHGDKDVNLSDDCNISGESRGFDPCLNCHEDTPRSETKDEVLQLSKEFHLTTSENNEDIQPAEEECTQADSLQIGNENVLNKSQDSRDFLDQNQDSIEDRLLDETEFTESTDTQNSESLLGPLETLVCSSNKEAAEYTESADTQNSESLFGPVETLVCSSNKEAAYTDKEQDSQSDSDSMLASKDSSEFRSSREIKEILRPESNGEEDLLNLPSEEESSSTDHHWTVQTEPKESVEKTVVSEEMEDKSEDSRDVSGKSLLSSIPALDLKGRTYSMSDLDSSDISIITLRSSEELDCWEGNDMNGDVLKQKNTQEKDIPSENNIHLKQELEGFQTPTVGSLKDTNESEQNTELTDVSSINYCPLPDFESDSWMDESTSALDINAKYISPSKNEIVISDSSDSLPEVLFLREEKTNRNFKTEYPDGEILSVKQEFVPLADDSSVSSTEYKNIGIKLSPQSPLTTPKSRPILRRRGLNSPRSDISTSTPLSCFDDETEGRKDSPRKRRKKKSPIKIKNKTPEKKQTTPRTTPKFKRRPLRKKNKSGKCCAEDFIELITDSESDNDDPSRLISPTNSAQKGRDQLKQAGTKSVTLNASRGSCKGNDLQGDLLQDIQDEDAEMDEKVQTSGGEASIQDIFNSEEFAEDSSLPASFGNDSLRSDIVLVVNSAGDDGKENSVTEEEDENTAVDSDDYCTDDKIQEIPEVDETVIPEDTAYASDEFSCQGDQDRLEESVDDDGDDDDEDDKDDEFHVSDDNNNSHIFPSSPPNHHPSDDDDVIPNTCDEDDDIDMPIPVLPPLSPWNQDEDVAPSQCLSPVFPDITKAFNTHTKTVERSRSDSDSNMFDSEEDFSAPDVDWNAFENTTSDDKMDEESELSAKNDEIRTYTMDENGEDDRSPSEYLGQSDSGDLHDEKTDGETITNTPTPNEASTSTNWRKRRQLFNDEEVYNFPLPKRPRTRQLSIENFTQFSPTSKLKRALDEDMLISTQCPLVSDISESQFEDASKRLISAEKATEGSAKKRKTREFLVNVKAKLMKYKTKKQSTPSQTESAPSSQETPGEMPVSSSVQRRILTEAEASNDRIAGYLSRCKDVISSLGQALEGRRLGTFPRVLQWRKDLSDIQGKTVLPRTTIAVVGDTGAGKSSLMNAVIDQLNTLPTSGMRACTAVVVEVLANTTSNNYEADIKFLSHQEWFDELQLLISDLTTADGKLKKHVPDLDSEAGVAFLKVKAVYGKVDTMAALKRLTAVTRMLDKVKTIKATNPKDFRRLIDRYIETADPGAGGQFWPIVKQVTIKMPNCDACSSGAVLVDLPGVRDSNAARDRIARDYLKNCTVVWVVAAIHRAINNKTAKEMLGENFRRQLLMDGQYGSVAFICTKSDDLMPSELIRNLRLDDECEALENEIESLIAEQNEAYGTIGRMKKEIRKIGKEITELTDNIADMKETIEQMDGVIDLDSEEGEGMESVKELRLCLADKEESLETIQSEKADKEKEMDKATRESLEIEKKIEVKRKEISAICAKARNEYSKSQIKRDFKAGLREMKRKAGLTNADEDDEMEDEDQDYISDDDDEEMGRTAENLRVFCVSSMEYQKMKNLLTNDGPPTVFSTTEDTQIPVLRRYIHELTSSRRQQHIERLIRTLGQFVFDVQSYIMADGATCKGTRRDAKFAVEENSKELREKFEPVLSRLTHDIEEIFCNSIETKMTNGVASAVSSANDTVSKWASKPNKEVRSEGGLHWKTYQCTVRRQGVYKSPTYGAIDFNEQLSEPMYRCISVCWDKVFSGLLWRTLENCRSLIMMTLATFVRDLCGKLQALEVDRSQTDRVSTQLCNSAKDKLAEMLTNLKELVLSRQRDISRVITPTVQENLDQTYTYCGGEAGNGMFMRIKQAMAGGVDYRRHNMFGEASRTLLDSLIQLKEDMVSHVRLVCRSLCEMLQAAFEPLWEAPSQTKLLKDFLFDSVTQAVLSVSNLHTDANISLPVPPTRDSTSNEDSPSPSDQSDQGNPDPQIDPALPGSSGLQMTRTAPVGPQMYTTTIGSTQRLVTDSHGNTKHVSVEMSKSTHVTDVLKHLKQEPGSTQVLSSTAIRKEWEPSSNLQEVSGPELNWLQRALPDLDSYDETQPSSGGKPKTSSMLNRPSSGISPQISSSVPRLQTVGPNRPGLSPPNSSTVIRPQIVVPTRPGNSSSVSTVTRPHHVGLTRPELSSQNTSSVTRRQILVPTRPGNSSQISTVTRPHHVGLTRPELSPQNSTTRPQIAVPSRPEIPPQISCLTRPQTVETPGFLHSTPHTSTLPDRVVVSNNTAPSVPSAAGLFRDLIQVDRIGKRFYCPSLGKVVTIPDKKSKTIAIENVAGKTLLLPKSVLIPVTASGSRVESSTPQGNSRTACSLPNPGVSRVNIPAVASGTSHQATNRPTVVRIEKSLSSPVSDSPAKQVVSIIDKNVFSSSQTKQPSSQASILSQLCSNKGSAEAWSSQTEQNSSPTSILSQLRSNKSSTGTNSPVTGTSNKGRLRLSLKKNSTPYSPLHPHIYIKQEPMEHNSAQQRRIRRANQNNYEVINLCDDSDINN